MPGKTRPPSPVGRFAPSPTGELHFGSLLAAVASRADALSRGGRWLVRVENIDPPREIEGSANRILADLAGFGMRPDAPVVYQADRSDAHRRARDRLLRQGLAYWCGCSRSDLPADGIYPGTCRAGVPKGRKPRTVRLRATSEPVTFEDRVMGEQTEDLQATVGDFVIWRADDLPAYQLAVVVDDAWQHVSEVVRGADLLDSTGRQIHLQRCLELPTPSYAHHPVAISADGRKLSKRLGADPVNRLPAARTLEAALRFLGQPCPDGLQLEAVWAWALENWCMARVPKVRERPFEAAAPAAG